MLPGTPHYIAPEIFEGYVDERSEVYSVGILLYQMLTGYVPFNGPSYQICLDHWKTQPLAPSSLNPSLPRPVERVILRAFQKAIEAPTFFNLAAVRFCSSFSKRTFFSGLLYWLLGKSVQKCTTQYSQDTWPRGSRLSSSR